MLSRVLVAKPRYSTTFCCLGADGTLSRSRSLTASPDAACYLLDANTGVTNSVGNMPIYAGQDTYVGTATISIVNGNTLRVTIDMLGSYLVNSGDEPKYEW